MPNSAIEPNVGPVASEAKLVKIAASLFIAGAILAGLYFGRDILIPFAIAFLITFMLNPPVTWLSRSGLPRSLSAGLVLLTLVIALGGIGVVLGAQFKSIAVELPRYQTTIASKLADLQDTIKAPGIFDGALRTIERVQKQIEAKEPKPTEGSPPQRVEVVPRPQTPLENAATWMIRSAEPLATVGIILLFVFLALLNIGDLRDRLLRLLGGNFHRSTDAMQDAGTRISQYLLMQLVVNVTYGIPLAVGLWMIGVPGALLWGALGAVMRFVPYIGPLISAVLPIALAFAVDDGWSMLLWTVALFAILELVSNNVVEPLLYGASTGLSALSLIAAAVVWTALWGPIGLMLSTPLTACLLVLGRNLPQLRFLDVLLGSSPVLDTPARIYQRLIAGDVDEAIEIAIIESEKSSVYNFYNTTGISTLSLANVEQFQHASADHRLHFASGMDDLLEELKDRYPSTIPTSTKKVVCIGLKSEIDALAGEMVAHALTLKGVAARSKPAASVTANYIAQLDLDGTEVICLSQFGQASAIGARHACRRLKKRFPNLQIVLALWQPLPNATKDNTLEKYEADIVVTSFEEAVYRIHSLIDSKMAKESQRAEIPTNDDQRVIALKLTRVLSGEKREELDALAKRAADVFNTDVAVISTINSNSEYFVGQSGELPDVVTDSSGLLLPMDRSQAICNYVVANDETLIVPDIARDPRFADNETIKNWNMRFYAGAPLRLTDGSVIGALCILDPKPRSMKDDEIVVLARMAADVVEVISSKEADESEGVDVNNRSSTTVGQNVPE